MAISEAGKTMVSGTCKPGRKALAWVVVFAMGALAGAAAAQDAAAGPDQVVHLWKGDVFDAEDALAQKQPPAIDLVGARNGTFSGKVVVAAGGPVRGLKTTAGDLKQGAAVITAANVRVRYGVPWPEGGKAVAKGNDILLESPPVEFAGQRVPVWVTVSVPRDAQPGGYAGQLTVEAQGLAPAAVPVRIDVQDWMLPDPQDYRTWVELIQSPDTLALEYDVPLWSDRHWELIGKSFWQMKDSGSRMLYVPLIAQCNAGNAESMVRWVQRGEDEWEWDFSVMDRYLDVAQEKMGTPKGVVFNIWDRYLTRPGAGGRDFQVQTGLRVAATGPIVTVVDTEGKVSNVTLPDYPFRESVTVSVERMREPPTAEAYLQKSLEESRNTLSGFRAQETGEATIDGQKAPWAGFSCRMGPFAMRARVYVLIEGDRAVSITCLSRPERYEQYGKTFDGIAGSFKFDLKGVELTCPEGWDKGTFIYRNRGVGVGVVAVAWAPRDGPDEPNAVRRRWAALFAQLRERMKARGLEKQMMVGMVSDFWPTREQIEFLNNVTGRLPWANAGHYSRKSLYDGLAGLGYQTSYFTPRLFGLFQREPASKHGWRQNERLTFFVRNNFDKFPIINWRLIAEQCITGDVRGIGRLGADTWLAVKDRRGRRAGRVWQRWPRGDWGYLNCNSSTLAPRADGPVTTARFEALREGVQECEALIVLEDVLLDKDKKDRVGEELAARAQAVLAERQAAVLRVARPGDRSRIPLIKPEDAAWYATSGWQERSRKLFATAGDLQRKLAEP